MKKKPSSVRPPRGAGWTKALDAEAYDRRLAEAYHYVRHHVRRISLSEAARRSGLCRQFWRLVEVGRQHPNSHNEVCMCNALRVRSSVMHRLAERWVRLGRKLVPLLAGLLPLEVEFLTATAGV